MKKLLSILLIVSMIVSLGVTAFAAETHEITSAAFPLYFDSDDMGMDVTLYFLDGVTDLPYIEVNDWLSLMDNFFDGPGTDINYSIETDGPVVTYTRHNSDSEAKDNGATMVIDFDKNSIDFMDYNVFCLRGNAATLLDTVTMNLLNEAGEPVLLEKLDTGSFTRYGDELIFPLSDYGIDLIMQDGLYLVPLQTMSDIVMPNTTMGSFFFNGQCVIVSADISACADLYYAAPTGDRSEALAEFGYNELCMMLDYFYGLKETHRIESFDRLFDDIGFKGPLTGPSAEQADKAIYRLTTDFLDDNHTDWHGFSYLAGPLDYSASGAARTKLFAYLERLNAAKAQFYPDGIPGYEEIGNTAYISFDTFMNLTRNGEDYYLVEDLQDFPAEDSIALIMRAHEQIYRENSPIENVVLDLSTNLGGSESAAVFTIAWFLGEAAISGTDNMTGAMGTTTYRADVNRDGVFDEKDTVADKNLFCLISPCSFSSGNLVPCVFKDSGMVTLLGRTSGGGACSILNVSTAWGTSFQISVNICASFLKNGAFYDVDRGAEPDYVLTVPDSFYDRAALTDYLNSLP
jgi:hypothetical protein